MLSTAPSRTRSTACTLGRWSRRRRRRWTGCGFLSLPEASPIDHLIDQHEAILDAAERGDVAAGEAAMRTHLTEVLAALEPLRQRHPDLFEPDEG